MDFLILVVVILGLPPHAQTMTEHTQNAFQHPQDLSQHAQTTGLRLKTGNFNHANDIFAWFKENQQHLLWLIETLQGFHKILGLCCFGTKFPEQHQTVPQAERSPASPNYAQIELEPPQPEIMPEHTQDMSHHAQTASREHLREKERIAKEKQERIFKEEELREKERTAKEKQERIARELRKKERIAKEEQERIAKEEELREKERIAKEEQERIAKEEQERIAMEKQEHAQTTPQHDQTASQAEPASASSNYAQIALQLGISVATGFIDMVLLCSTYFLSMMSQVPQVFAFVVHSGAACFTCFTGMVSQVPFTCFTDMVRQVFATCSTYFLSMMSQVPQVFAFGGRSVATCSAYFHNMMSQVPQLSRRCFTCLTGMFNQVPQLSTRWVILLVVLSIVMVMLLAMVRIVRPKDFCRVIDKIVRTPAQGASKVWSSGSWVVSHLNPRTWRWRGLPTWRMPWGVSRNRLAMPIEILKHPSHLFKTIFRAFSRVVIWPFRALAHLNPRTWQWRLLPIDMWSYVTAPFRKVAQGAFKVLSIGGSWVVWPFCLLAQGASKVLSAGSWVVSHLNPLKW